MPDSPGPCPTCGGTDTYTDEHDVLLYDGRTFAVPGYSHCCACETDPKRVPIIEFSRQWVRTYEDPGFQGDPDGRGVVLVPSELQAANAAMLRMAVVDHRVRVVLCVSLVVFLLALAVSLFY